MLEVADNKVDEMGSLLKSGSGSPDVCDIDVCY